VGPDEIGRLADTFRFGRTQIAQAVRLADSISRLREPVGGGPALPDMFNAGRELTAPRLGRFAMHVIPRYSWDDLVLPVEKQNQLRRLANWVRYRHRVHEEWGFGRKLTRGKGLNVLFTGPSGTGKTMAAEVLAGELELDLYQIDLSSVVSKFIGETEQHLAVIFDEAEDSQAILFFDEADALFGKRTEVKDAHDRYANIEVNFLLQRVEQYQGVVILASNLQRNLDEAFLRRMYDVVEFLFPDPPLRERMWRNHVPREAERDPDIDFPFLASQFKVTGGSIKNIVLDAAFRAAATGRPLGMTHLMLATKAELQKQGKLPTKADFGPYYDLVMAKPQGPREDR
jgi:SpoVK/Ycf46/Vps4 family AAA+-type ATPase